MLKLFGFARVNKVARGNTRDLRVLWALEEMQLPFEIVGIDHPKHELTTDEFKRRNPFEQLPVIEDEGAIVTESAAILIYLAKKSGTLIPKDLAGETQVLRWSFAAMSSVELPMMSIPLVDWTTSDSGGYRDFLVSFAKKRLASLEAWLDGRTWIATDEFTVADILMSHVLFPPFTADLVAECPRVQAYKERCEERPAWQKVKKRYFERVEAG
jgi:glutathione S-transferase